MQKSKYYRPLDIKNPQISYILRKTSVFSIMYSKCDRKGEKIFKEKSIKTLKIHGLINNIEQYQKIWLKKT